MTRRRPQRVGFVVLPPEGPGSVVSVYLMHLPDGEPMLLTGTAALIWVLGAEGDADVAGAVAELLDVERPSIADDVDRYLDVLVQQGWLEVAS